MTPSLFCTPEPPTSSTWVGARTGAGRRVLKCLVLPPAGPLGTLDNVWRWFGLSHPEEGGCYWHLVGEDQGCRSGLYGTQDGPTTENDPPSNVNVSLDNPAQGNGNYLGGCLEDTAAIRLPVWGWKAGTASSVYKPPSCRWFRLTRSVITTRPVS